MFARYLLFLLMLLVAQSVFSSPISVERDATQGAGNKTKTPPCNDNNTTRNGLKRGARPVDDSTAMIIEKEITPVKRAYQNKIKSESKRGYFKRYFTKLHLPSSKNTELILCGKTEDGQITFFRVGDHSVYELGALSKSPQGLKHTYEYYDGNWYPVSSQ